MLRQMQSGDIVEGDEKYEFTWVGKKAAIVRSKQTDPQNCAPALKKVRIGTQRKTSILRATIWKC